MLQHRYGMLRGILCESNSGPVSLDPIRIRLGSYISPDQALGKAVMKVQDILDAFSRSGIVQKMDAIVLAELARHPWHSYLIS